MCARILALLYLAMACLCPERCYLVRGDTIDLLKWASAGYLTQAQGLITTDASRASFISTFTVRVAPSSFATETSGCMRDP